MQHPTPTRVEPREGYRIWLEFSDGLSGEIDLSRCVQQDTLQAWRDRQFFAAVHLDKSRSIAWSDDLYLCSDLLYAQLKGITLEAQDAIWDAQLKNAPQEPHPTTVEPREGYRIWLEFSDGLSGEIDLSAMAEAELCKPLQERTFFEQVHIDEYGAIAWNDDIDLCPDSLYAELAGITRQER